MAYYISINGIRYDRALIEAAQAFTKGRGESKIALDEIQALFKLASDGKKTTETEWRTLRYIGEHFSLTAPAKGWLEDQFNLNGGPSEIENTINRILGNEFGLKSVQWQFESEEVKRQLAISGNITDLGQAVRGTLNALMTRGMNILSLESVVRRRDLAADEKGIAQTIRDFMNDGGQLFLVPADESERQNFSFDLPENLDFNLFWHIGLHIPALSPVLFMASVSRTNPNFYHSKGNISRRPSIDDLSHAVVRQLTQFMQLEYEIDEEEVQRQLLLRPGQNFGEALFGALEIGIFNGESSFSFRDFIHQEVWVDPDRQLSDYQREYIESGKIYLLSPEGNSNFPIPENLKPDFEIDWVFGLEMPKRTEVRYIITVSREMGFEASWNDGFGPDSPTLAQQTLAALSTFGLPDLKVVVAEEEYEAQRTQFGPDWRSFSSLLRQAINTILHDYVHPNSVFYFVSQAHIEEIKPSDFDDVQEYRSAIAHRTLQYLKTGNLEFLPIELPDNYPVSRQPIQEYWQFLGSMPALTDTSLWVIIPRWPDDIQQAYCEMERG